MLPGSRRALRGRRRTLNKVLNHYNLSITPPITKAYRLLFVDRDIARNELEENPKDGSPNFRQFMQSQFGRAMSKGDVTAKGNTGKIRRRDSVETVHDPSLQKDDKFGF